MADAASVVADAASVGSGTGSTVADASRLKTDSWPPITLTRGFGLVAAKTEEIFPIG